jgi:tripartite-type tricarboxylate transporter receptor subunit TctC
MNLSSSLSWRFIAATVVALGLAAPAIAQDVYPSRPIRIIVPFPPGGGTDILARTVGAKLTESWKLAVVVDNRPGGNTIIGAQLAANSSHDGYTLFVAIDSTLAMNPSLYAKLPYDPVKDFAPITLATSMPMVLAVHPRAEANSVKELIALAKAKPGQMSYAHGALPAQVAGELFKSMARVDMVAVPYKGSSPAITDVVGGSVPVIFDALGPSMSFIKGGKLKALAVTSGRRSAALPDVPTLAESAVPGYDLVTWTGFLAPAGTSKEIVAKLNGELVRILNLPDTKEKLAAIGVEVIGSTPEQFARVIKDDSAKFDRIIKSAGIRVE